MEDCKAAFGKINGDSFPFTRSWIPSLMCSSSFPNCAEALVCFSMSWLKMTKSLSRASSERYARSDKATASWWFSWTAGMMVSKRLWTVDINKDKCCSCCAFGFCKVVVEGLHMSL